MDQDYITRREHEEFARRMDSENERIKDENARQNKRIAIVEESVSEFNKLADRKSTLLNSSHSAKARIPGAG